MGLRPYQLQGERGWAGREGPPREDTKERREVWGASCVSAAVHFAPGPGDQEAVAQANCMLPPRLHHFPPPTTWLSATEKATVSFLVSGGRGHMWGQVYHLAGGSRFQRSRGLNALSPRGPTSLGNSFPLFLPSLPLSRAGLQRNPSASRTECPCQSSLRRTSKLCPLSHDCPLIIPLLRYLFCRIKTILFPLSSAKPWAPGGQRMSPNA